MKKTASILAKSALVAAMSIVALPSVNAAEVNGWGDFKLYLDPGHQGRENQGLWGYSEAEKTLRVALNIKDMLEKYTDMPAENLKLCRYTDQDAISLEERSDAANAWGADFYYSIHSDASADQNTTVTLFGGWRKDGVEIEKTPNGGKAYGEILNPNLSGVMRIGTRGNWHDRCFYDRAPQTHTNQYPYLSVNRRSNMPSLLSEGGYHTIASQQQRNINDDYKRLEAFAAFQSILGYRGLALPAQTFLTGMVTNSENGQPINGATITVDGKTYTTDTFESVFSKYTKNPDLIHNGFYFFEGLEANKEYTVDFAAPGFESKSTTVKINAGGANSADYVTYLDVELTNMSPATVAASLTSFTGVSPVYPFTLTFSRNMDRESVEKAFSVDNDGEVSLEWINDYTLSVDISKLLPLWSYTFTIDGSVAKNSQTGMLLDGDRDGQPGGNFLMTIEMAEPDVTAPAVVSTYPAADGEALYCQNPPIRIEFSEIIDWNDDKNADFVTVTDADGKEYAGTVTHAVINDASVLHFYTHEPFAADKAVLVSVAEGLTDLSGNAAAAHHFRFLTEYRAKTGSTVVDELKSEGDFWAPGGSGSSKGLTEEANFIGVANVAPFYGENASFEITYDFDENYADEYWHIRDHNPKGNLVKLPNNKGILTMWVYGDGSNNRTGVYMRNYSTNGLNAKADEEGNYAHVVDYRGWNLFVWDMENDPVKAFTGDGSVSGRNYLDAIFILHEYTDPDDEEIPQTLWRSKLAYNNLEFSQWDNDAERTAKLSDVAIPSEGVEAIGADAVNVVVNGDVIVVSAPEAVKSVSVYDLKGSQVAAATGKGNIVTVSAARLAAGVYIIKAETAGAVKTVKMVRR